jgi:hypothetical protein
MKAAVAAAEKAAEVDPTDWVGYADPELCDKIVKLARAHLTSNDPLRRAGKFLFGTFWFSDEFTRIKQLRTQIAACFARQPGSGGTTRACSAPQDFATTSIQSVGRCDQ